MTRCKQFLVSAVMCCCILVNSGCYVQSYYAFFDPDQELIDVTEKLKGEWIGSGLLGDCPSNDPWRVFFDGCQITISGGGVKPVGILNYNCFRVGDVLLMDTSAAKPSEDNVNWAWWCHVAPTHSLWRMRFGDDSVCFDALSAEWIEEHEDSVVDYCRPKQLLDARMLLVSKTDTLTRFIEQNIFSEHLFDTNCWVLLRRPRGEVGKEKILSQPQAKNSEQ